MGGTCGNTCGVQVPAGRLVKSGPAGTAAVHVTTFASQMDVGMQLGINVERVIQALGPQELAVAWGFRD